MLTPLSGQRRQPFLLHFFWSPEIVDMLRSKARNVAETLNKQAAFLPERL